MLELFNTYTGRKEVFQPLEKGVVKMYNCGPTVYDYAHIGNFRSYLFADLLRRWLEYRGFSVRQIMNVTDVGHMTHDAEADSSGDDKIESAARKEKKTPEEIADFFFSAFREDAEALRIKKPWKMPRATDHIAEMCELIKLLIDKGNAYKVPTKASPSGDNFVGGSGQGSVQSFNVYFDISSFPNYGKLSGNMLKGLKPGARSELRSEKKHPGDFALWKSDSKHIMQWDSPFGRGFPGWHIECSAMSMRYLGESFDIHTGGEDNIFPHHECELAQSESATGRQFVRYWLHARHMLVAGEKMSKSLGNYYTLRDIARKHNPLSFRFLCLSTHYRKPMNFTLEALSAAEKSAESIDIFVKKLRFVMDNAKRSLEMNKEIILALDEARQSYETALDDDLNAPMALSAVFELMNVINSAIDADKADLASVRDVYNFMNDFNRVFDTIQDDDPLTQKEEQLLKQREEARRLKDYEKSDEIRKLLTSKGIIIEDTAYGTFWRRRYSS